MTGSELFAHVLAAPDADEPRAVFADWLIERGDPRMRVGAAQERNVGDLRDGDIVGVAAPSGNQPLRLPARERPADP